MVKMDDESKETVLIQQARDALNFMHSAMLQAWDQQDNPETQYIIEKWIREASNHILDGKWTIDHAWEQFYRLVD